jgi:hypothetical protein
MTVGCQWQICSELRPAHTRQLVLYVPIGMFAIALLLNVSMAARNLTVLQCGVNSGTSLDGQITCRKAA